MKRAVLALFVACSESSGYDDAWVLRDAKQDIAVLEAALAAPKVSSSITRCGHMANIAILEKQDRAVADRLRQLCTKDILIGVMNARIDAIEAKRTAKPDVDMTIVCVDPFYENAKDEMTKFATLAAAKAVVARYDALCPPTRPTTKSQRDR
jgi:hypothetical protein